MGSGFAQTKPARLQAAGVGDEMKIETGGPAARVMETNPRAKPVEAAQVGFAVHRGEDGEFGNSGPVEELRKAGGELLRESGAHGSIEGGQDGAELSAKGLLRVGAGTICHLRFIPLEKIL